MKAIIISINSIHELTGGGLYLRTLYNEYRDKYSQFDILCKNDSVHEKNDTLYKKSNILWLKKNFLIDIFSRLLLCPSFLGFHIFQILKICLKYDVVHIHSSRNLPIAYVLKNVFRKNVYVHFDNVEHKLSKSMIAINYELPLRLTDFFLLFIWENLLAKYSANKVTFITSEDLKFLNLSNAVTLPIKVPYNKEFDLVGTYTNRCSSVSHFKVIFVASFSHFPNLKAYNDLIEVAQEINDVQFVIAGRGASNLDSHGLSNIIRFSDVTDEELGDLYNSCHVCVSLVSSGGGMKTKVAEALSFNLPVIASSHSLIGYDDLEYLDLVYAVSSKDDVINAIKEVQYLYNHRCQSVFEKLWAIYKKEYCIE
jgi:glycosyltransferase involved in cell wall biosynthesis